MEKFDVIVIGGGPGGYVAAIRAAQLNARVALIEAKEMGGTCLNRGCIPSKTLLANAQLAHKIREADKYGIEVSEPKINFPKMMERKDGVVTKVRKSLTGLIEANKIKVFNGFGKFTDPHTIKIMGEDNVMIQGKKIIIATGSEPKDIPAFPFDHEKILSSTSVLELKKLPKSLAIIGGGYIGCEFASCFADYGVEIHILEAMPTIIPLQGPDLAGALTRTFESKGVQIHTNVFVEGIDKTKDGVLVKLKDQSPVHAEMALVAVGRSLNTDNIGLEKAGVLTNRGVIEVNERLETNVPGIYAIGDVTGKWMLAHVASHQGITAANNALGIPHKMHYNAVPAVVFTNPEIATAGLLPHEAKEQGLDVKVSKYPFMALGKSQASLETEGFVQIVSDSRTGLILGAQVIGHEASALIAQLTLAIRCELTIEDLADTIHAHPTVAEAWLEAALIANDAPIHFPPKRKMANV